MALYRNWSVIKFAQTTNSRDIFSFNLPAGFSRHSVRHGKTRPAEAEFTVLLKMRGATQVHNEYARPSDGANVSHVRLPVRQQNLDFREGCGVGRPPIRLERMDVDPAGAPREHRAEIAQSSLAFIEIEPRLAHRYRCSESIPARSHL